MKLSKDTSNTYNKTLITNNIIKKQLLKPNNNKEIKNKNPNSLEKRNDLAAKSAFDFENLNNQNNKIEKIKSSIFQNNNNWKSSSKHKTNYNNNNSFNKTKSIDEKSDYFTINNKENSKINNNVTNFSSSFSSKTNFPEIKSTERKSNLSSSNTKITLAFFKVPNNKKSNAISLKKNAANFEKINGVNYLSNEKSNKYNLNINRDNALLKYPKKPSNIDYYSSSLSNRTNFNSIINDVNNLQQKLLQNKINGKNNNEEINKKFNLDNSFEKIKNVKNNSSNSKAKLNENLNTFFLNKTKQELETKLSLKHKTTNGFSNNNNLNALNKNNFSHNKNLVNKINVRSKENSISPIKENNNFNSNPHISLNNCKATNNVNSSYNSPKATPGKRKLIPPNTAENRTGNIKKYRSIHNFFKSENLLNNNININNNNENSYINNIQNAETTLIKLASIKNTKKILLRPKTVNGIEFKFNAKINQETYKTVQDVLEMPTTYLPFSKKRNKQSELEKQSFQFQNKVEKELKEAKQRQARKITIKSKNELSNYLMRDYFIGEKGDTANSSKKRMKITKDFERDKEVQKKKKMAFLKNEEYKETDKEDLSDSDESQLLFEFVDEEGKQKEQQQNDSIDTSRNALEKEYNDELNDIVENNKINENNKNSLINKNINNESESYIKNKNPRNEKDDYFKQEDNSNIENKISANFDEKEGKSKSSNSLNSDYSEKSIQSNASQKEEYLAKEIIRTSSLAVNSNNQNINSKRKESLLNNFNNNNNTRNRKSIEGNKSLNFRNTLGSFNNKSFLNTNQKPNNRKRTSAYFTLSNNNNKEKIQSGLFKTEKEEEDQNNEYNENNANENNLKKQSSSKSNLTNKINLIKNSSLERLQDLISAKKKKLENKVFENIKIRSVAKADQILDISLGDYLEIEQEDSDGLPSNNVNLANLNRVIRVRNILKGKHKDDDEKREFQGMQKESDEDILKVLRFQRLGPPSFLKTNFKKETEIKFKMLGGKFFGCQV